MRPTPRRVPRQARTWWRARVWRQVYLFMPRDRKGIGRTGNKQTKAKAKLSSQTSSQVVEAEAGAVAEAEAPAEAAEQPSPAVLGLKK